MAINESDPINFHSAVDYFKLYNNESLSSGTPKVAAITSHRSETQPTSSSSSNPSSNSASVPLVTATTLTTLTSTIINNYSNHNNKSHHKNSTINNSNQSSTTLNLLRNLSQHNSNADSSDQQDFNSNFSNMNDSAKIPYESGSNFMLLLEDFGEYFYNYNGSDYQNSTISIYQSNCSLPNSTCTDTPINETRESYLSLSFEIY